MRLPPNYRSERLFPRSIRDQTEVEFLESQVLADNPMGDPARRPIVAYRPPSGATEGRPLLLYLSGFTGTGWIELNKEQPFHETFFQTFDRMVRARNLPEAVVVSPDAFTSLGGSQYVDSEATGRYAEYVVREVVPWAQERFRTRGVGLVGHSSGGFGALHLALEHPGRFTAVGSSAGDLGFEYCYLPDFPKAVRAFRKYGGPDGFLRRFSEDPSIARAPDAPGGAALNFLAMSACYSPNRSDPGAFDLPIDPETGAIVPEIWNRWLAFDPVRRVQTSSGRDALRELRSLHITSSGVDEFFLDVGAAMFLREATRAEVPVSHAEFEGGHFDRTPRFESILSRMMSALTAA